MSLLDHRTLNQCLLAVKPKEIFDVGCGVGRWFEWCQKHGIHYKGYDIDSEVVERARAQFHVGEEVFQIGDINILCKEADDSHDIVLLVEVIEHIRTQDLLTALLKECYRVAKRFVFITTPNCSCEAMLLEHGLIYEHYRYAAADGMQFRLEDRAHRHWLNFTLDNLTQHLERHFAGQCEVVESQLIKVLTFPAYHKLWAVIKKEDV